MKAVQFGVIIHSVPRPTSQPQVVCSSLASAPPLKKPPPKLGRDAPSKPAVRRLIEAKVRRKELVPVAVEGAGKQEHWASPEALESAAEGTPGLVHILSPFDPLMIQRKRTELFFGYGHRF